jgi:hypothetical protein
MGLGELQRRAEEDLSMKVVKKMVIAALEMFMIWDIFH